MAYTAAQIKALGLSGKLTPDILAAYKAQPAAQPTPTGAYTPEAAGAVSDSTGTTAIKSEAYNTYTANQSTVNTGGTTDSSGLVALSRIAAQPDSASQAAQAKKEYDSGNISEDDYTYYVNATKTSSAADSGAGNTTNPTMDYSTNAISPVNLYDVNTSNLSSGTGTYNSLSDLGVSNSAVLDPYTRGLMAAGITSGQLYDIVTNTGYNNTAANRIGVMQGAAEESANANMGVALTDVQNQMQKAGKYSSSATTSGMMRTAETYSANLAQTVATGTLNIYSELDSARNDELNRIAASGEAATTADTERWNTIVSATVDLEKTKIQDQANRDIADMQSNLQQRVAEIEANTTLTGYQKDLEKQAASDLTQKQINEYQGKVTIAKDAADNTMTKYGVDVGSQTQIKITGLSTASNQLITQMNISEEDKQLLQTMAITKLTQLDKDGNPEWLDQLNETKLPSRTSAVHKLQ